MSGRSRPYQIEGETYMRRITDFHFIHAAVLHAGGTRAVSLLHRLYLLLLRWRPGLLQLNQNALANENDVHVPGLTPYVGAATYQNFEVSSPGGITVNALATNNLSSLNPSSAYWEIRSLMYAGNGGVLIASGTGTGADFFRSPVVPTSSAGCPPLHRLECVGVMRHTARRN